MAHFMTALSAAMTAPATVMRGSYTHSGFSCSYQHKAAAPGHESDPPLLLVHPVGIGLSSWFWTPFLDSWHGGAVWAPDLIGCGQSEAWIPAQKGLFVPLDWVRQVEALWACEIRRPTVLVTQGGLAPLGVMAASRDSWSGSRAFCGLVLASPPVWGDLVEGLKEDEVSRNYRLLTSPLGIPAYSILTTRPFVKFFSDLFLFASTEQQGCDERWLEECAREATPEARAAVLAFNAGLVGLQPLGERLRSLPQPVLVLEGDQDPRRSRRRGFTDEMADCRQLQIEQSKNVLPWEQPAACCAAIADFAASSCQ